MWRSSSPPSSTWRASWPAPIPATSAESQAADWLWNNKRRKIWKHPRKYKYVFEVTHSSSLLSAWVRRSSNFSSDFFNLIESAFTFDFRVSSLDLKSEMTSFVLSYFLVATNWRKTNKKFFNLFFGSNSKSIKQTCARRWRLSRRTWDHR